MNQQSQSSKFWVHPILLWGFWIGIALIIVTDPELLLNLVHGTVESLITVLLALGIAMTISALVVHVMLARQRRQ